MNNNILVYLSFYPIISLINLFIFYLVYVCHILQSNELLSYHYYLFFLKDYHIIMSLSKFHNMLIIVDKYII